MGWANRKLVERPAQMPEEETYQAKLRSAIYNGISEADVTDVVKGVVARAKEGSAKDVELLFKHLLTAEKTPQTFIQNNYHGADAKPKLKRNGQPGKGAPSDAKLSVLRSRAEAGDEMFSPEDE